MAGAPQTSTVWTLLKLSVCSEETWPVGASLPAKQGTVFPDESVAMGFTVSLETQVSGPQGIEIIRSQAPPKGRILVTQ